MELLTVTCTRDKYLMQLLAHSLNLFLEDPCVHHVVIEDNETSYADWLSLLLPHYSRHQLRIVHDYNMSHKPGSNDGYYRQQQIKLQMAEKIHTEKYMILDSDCVFFKPVRLSDWPHEHGNGMLATSDYRTAFPDFQNWISYICNKYSFLPDEYCSLMTPYLIDTKIARSLINDINVVAELALFNENLNVPGWEPSEFILYFLYAQQFDRNLLIPDNGDHRSHIWIYPNTIGEIPVEIIERISLTFGIDKRCLNLEYLKELSVYYHWLLSKGISQQYLDEAWFDTLFDESK